MDSRNGEHSLDLPPLEFLPYAEGVEKVPDALFQLLASVVDQLAFGIAVVAVDATIVHANRAAICALRGCGLRVTAQSKLESIRAGGNDALEAALRAIAAHRRTLLALGSDQNRLTVAVQPLFGHPQPRRATRALLVFSKPALCAPAAVGAFVRAYRLTPAESVVLAALCSGLRAKEVAVRTRSSIATVRSHLRNIYSKTDASNLQDLLLRLAALPPLAS